MSKTIQFTKQLPWDEILSTLDALAEAGWEKDAAVELIARLLDDALPLDELVPGPGGVALEALDGPVLRAALGLLWTLASKAEGRKARKARRKLKLHTADTGQPGCSPTRRVR